MVFCPTVLRNREVRKTSFSQPWKNWMTVANLSVVYFGIEQTERFTNNHMYYVLGYPNVFRWHWQQWYLTGRWGTCEMKCLSTAGSCQIPQGTATLPRLQVAVSSPSNPTLKAWLSPHRAGGSFVPAALKGVTSPNSSEACKNIKLTGNEIKRSRSLIK